LRQRIRIKDLTGETFRLITIDNESIVTHSVVDEIVDTMRDDPPVLFIIDPMVSFGTGENRVNDMEQGLVTAARRIVRKLGCCVRYVHHTGQEVARNRTVDAYATRGGTALPDGCRMVAILHCHDGDENAKPPQSLAVGQLLRLSLPKVSWARKQKPIWISRDGCKFDYADEQPPVPREVEAAAEADQVERFLISELGGKYPAYYTKKDVEDAKDELNLSRPKIRAVLKTLITQRRIVMRMLPGEYREGAKQEFLCPSRSRNDYDIKGGK